MKMKKGDIIENRWAGKNNPTRFFIYLGASGRYINGLEYIGGRLKKVQYYKADMNDLLPDGRPVFDVVGHSNGFEVLKNDLKIELKNYKGAVEDNA